MKKLKMPTKKDWAKLMNKIPSEDVGLNKNGDYDTRHAPEFRKWLRNG